MLERFIRGTGPYVADDGNQLDDGRGSDADGWFCSCGIWIFCKGKTAGLMVREDCNMKLQLMDCTLRDGANVVERDFPQNLLIWYWTD